MKLAFSIGASAPEVRLLLSPATSVTRQAFAIPGKLSSKVAASPKSAQRSQTDVPAVPHPPGRARLAISRFQKREVNYEIV